MPQPETPTQDDPLVDIVIQDARWQTFAFERLVERAAQATFQALNLAPEGFEISLLGCDDTRIAELNGDFRAKPQPTNVLSWPSQERGTPGKRPKNPQPQELGDIAIAFETCQREAKEAHKPLEDHATHLIIHGVLHLFGYDHQSDVDATLMEGLEIAILSNLGISNPYEKFVGKD